VSPPLVVVYSVIGNRPLPDLITDAPPNSKLRCLLLLLPFVALSLAFALNQLRRHQIKVAAHEWCILAEQRRVFIIKSGPGILAPSWWPSLFEEYYAGPYVLVSITYRRDVEALSTMPECPAALFVETGTGITRTSVAEFIERAQAYDRGCVSETARVMDFSEVSDP
jgi:hypothetical protein